MAARKTKPQNTTIDIDFGAPNSEKQWEFMCSEKKYTNYGGARGGGKSWASRTKAGLLSLQYAGIKILFVRREYDNLENSVISPLLSILPPSVYNYNKSEHVLTFINGSTIKFGNMPGYSAAVMGKYQGQEYDVLFIEEATQFTETEFRGLVAIVRGANAFPKRVYLTCNPGGVGHNWVKRIFVDRKFKADEDPDDYLFIQATVDDNKDLMEANPDYVKALMNLPPDIMRAHRYGDWSALSGSYFGEFTEGIHTCPAFPIPKNWARYRAFDYGLDMFACLWVAVDPDGRCYVYREYNESDLTVTDAAGKQLALTLPSEDIQFSIAPPDMWAKQRETGKTMAQTFAANGVPLLKADNSRVQGWAAVKELFRVREDGKPGLIIFNNCERLIECVKCVQHDDQNPNDVSKKPHELTHSPDALRYFCQTYVSPGTEVSAQQEYIEEEDGEQDYVAYMCGGEPSMSYIGS